VYGSACFDDIFLDVGGCLRLGRGPERIIVWHINHQTGEPELISSSDMVCMNRTHQSTASIELAVSRAGTSRLVYNVHSTYILYVVRTLRVLE
jgi:hypothetical protein